MEKGSKWGRGSDGVNEDGTHKAQYTYTGEGG